MEAFECCVFKDGRCSKRERGRYPDCRDMCRVCNGIPEHLLVPTPDQRTLRGLGDVPRLACKGPA